MPALTTRDIAAHIAQICDAQVSEDTISRISDFQDCRLVQDMQARTRIQTTAK